MDNKRRFTRIIYSTPATLHGAEDEWDVELVDLSLKGALIRKRSNINLDTQKQYRLVFNLDGTETTKIVMSTQLSHKDGHLIGLKCHHIDIDSASHLKRLIELNVGNDELLHREIEHLTEEPA